MLPGNTIIRQCASCPQLIEQSTIESGNTFGAKFWTDGWQDAPMMPDQPWLIECPQCQALLWIDELEIAGEVEALGSYENSKPYHVPDAAACLRLVDDSLADMEKKKYLRLRAWWAGNDERRESKTKNPLSEQEKENLVSLAELMDETDDNDRLMKAEIMRELGRFDEAAALIAAEFESEYTRAVQNIKDLIAKKEPFVAEMQFD